MSDHRGSPESWAPGSPGELRADENGMVWVFSGQWRETHTSRSRDVQELAVEFGYDPYDLAAEVLRLRKLLRDIAATHKLWRDAIDTLNRPAKGMP